MVHHLLSSPVPDGGGWESFEALVHKYGIVPQHAMNESASTKSTETIASVLNELLLQVARRIRAGTAHESVDGAMKRVHRLLCVCFGVPPKEFVWTFERKASGNADATTPSPDVQSVVMSPLQLFHACNLILPTSTVMLSHVPSKDTHKQYVVECFQTVLGGRDPKPFVNVDESTFRGAIYNTVRASTPVWFACEFDADRTGSGGLLHHDLLRYERVVGEPLERDKKARLEARAVDINHAMLITGYHEEHSSVVRWQVENSHGTEQTDGYLAMSDEWLRRHVYTVVVPRHMVPNLPWSMETVRVPPWDVFGQVARVGRKKNR